MVLMSCAIELVLIFYRTRDLVGFTYILAGTAAATPRERSRSEVFLLGSFATPFS